MTKKIPVVFWLLLPILLLGLSSSAADTVVNDVTQINPIVVDKIVSPTSIVEIQELVRNSRGPISIGGGRFSMGGQIATENALFIDMRSMNRVVELLPEKHLITVEAGITWRKIQEAIDPQQLALKIMQSYSNFTVGGSLSVNVHGRYVGQGPLIGSVKSIKVVLADGTLVEASRTKNSSLFFGAIGGYGGLGIIVQATLELADNKAVERSSRKMGVKEYKDYFVKEIRGSGKAIFHNGDIYPPAYERVRTITWSETDKAVTVEDHLPPQKNRYWTSTLFYLLVSEFPFGKPIREWIIDPLRLRGDAVVWRNYEASYDVQELEPLSRSSSTYVLQEYFVPVEKFDAFVPKMAEIFRRHRANVINVSIRHAMKDPGSLLAWAKAECFAFVVYYKQGVSDGAKKEVGVWTRELVDAVLAVDGSYYLPYQIHATEDQFRRAYPRAKEFFALKEKLDPQYRFRNHLWDRYYHPKKVSAAAVEKKGRSAGQEPARFDVKNLKESLRGEEQTFLTLPEWYIVYSADEFAAFVAKNDPSRFAYFQSIGQFWRAYRAIFRRTWRQYPFNWGYHVMIGVIGVSFTGENFFKGIYESTVGRFSEWIAGGRETAEERFIRKVYKEYGDFIHSTPWYEFPFAKKLGEFWDRMPPEGSFFRRWERRVSFSLELSFKAAYGYLINGGTHAAYERPVLETRAWVVNGTGKLDPRIRVLDRSEILSILAVPRYEPFCELATTMARQGYRFKEVEGNRHILVTLMASRRWLGASRFGEPLLEWPMLTDPALKRVAITVPVDKLHVVLRELPTPDVRVDHVYDY